MAAGQQPLGSLLVELGFIDDEQLESALDEQQRSGKRLGKILVDAAVITEERLVQALSRQLGIDTCDPLTTHIHDRVLKLIPIELAYRHRVVPVALKKEDTGEVVFVATSDPLNKTALSELRGATGNRRVRWLIAGETAMELALARHYGAPPKRSSRPLPEGMQVITGKPISAPRMAQPTPMPSQPPPSSPPPPRSSDLFMLSKDLGGFGYAGEDLPPIEVPPELLASPDAALRIIEAEMPRAPTNGSADLPEIAEELEMIEVDAVEADAPVTDPPPPPSPPPPVPMRSPENGHRALPKMPPPSQPIGMSWGDLLGGDLVLPSVFPWQPDPMPSPDLKPPERTQEVEDDRIEVEEPVEDSIDISVQSELPSPFEIEEPVNLEDDPAEMISELAARVKEVADAVASSAATQPGQIVEEQAADPTDVGSPPVRRLSTSDLAELQEDLPDASLDASPIDDATQTETSRAAMMRQVLLRFVHDGVLEVGPQAILRVLASIMEREGLLTEEKIAAALDANEE
jgi:hypothetical protein